MNDVSTIPEKWHKFFCIALRMWAKSGKVTVVESDGPPGLFVASTEVEGGLFEVVCDDEGVLTKHRGTQRRAIWTDEPPDWSAVRWTDMDNWKYEDLFRAVPMPLPANRNSSWAGMMLPGALIFALWNAWLRAAK